MTKPSSSCRFCGKAITFSQQHVFRGTCEAAECQAHLFQLELSEFKLAAERRHEARKALAFKFAHIDNPKCYSTDSTLPVVYPVPCMNGELTVLPAERRAQFQEHLQKSVTEAFEEPLFEASETEQETETNNQIAPPSPVVIAACSTCRGDCCRQGETHAFVTKELIVRIRRHHPTATQQEIVEMYDSRLSSITQEGSCVYHQERGCGLPRELRANICNSFECEDLRYIFRESPATTLVIVSLDGEVGIRSQVLAANQTIAPDS